VKNGVPLDRKGHDLIIKLDEVKSIFFAENFINALEKKVS
jgi:hypothetical protein